MGSKALIEHTIAHAKAYKKFDRIIVSTDDKAIAKISQQAGAETPFLRPKKISRDSTSMIEVIKHTKNYLKTHESYEPDIIVLLQPTSPFRSKDLIKNSINSLKNSKASCVISVAETTQSPVISFYKSGKYLVPSDKNFQKFSLRQKRNPIYYPTGSVYTFWSNNLSKFNSIYGTKIMPLIIKEKNHLIDIDDWYDFFLAEHTLKFWSKYKQAKIKSF